MKQKMMLSLAAVALLTASCSNENDVRFEELNDANAISFAPYSVMTKGTPIIGNEEVGNYENESYFKRNGRQFHVAAYFTSNTPADQYLNATVTFDSKWDYTNKAYWPSTPLNFYAVTPTMESNLYYINDIDAEGVLIDKYAVSAITSEQQDLMYSVLLNQSKPQIGGTVVLPFKHALNQVLFKAKTESKNLKVILNPDSAITLHNIRNVAEFASSRILGEVDNPLYQSGWGNYEGFAKYTNHIFGDKAIEICTNAETPNSINLTDPTNVLMLIPQAITPWNISVPIATNNSTSGEKGAYLKISCKLIATNDAGTDLAYLHGSQGAFANMYVPFNGQGMEQIGKKITYTLIFGGGYTPGEGTDEDKGDPKPILTPIEFDTNVEPWEEFIAEDFNTQPAPVQPM